MNGRRRNKINKFPYLPVIILLLLVGHTYSQEVRASASVDTNKIRIGEQTRIKLQLFFNKKRSIAWPLIGDTLRKEIDVVALSKIDTLRKANELVLSQVVTITSFDSGYWAVAPFRFIIDGDTSHPVDTEPFLLEVKTIPVDTSEASIKDVKGPFGENTDWREYLPYVYWGLAGLLILAAIIFLTLRFAKKKPLIPVTPKPELPPHVIAMQEFERIRELKLWQAGKYKEYHTLIADAVRLYLEGRYKIAAMELTSAEILKIMRTQVIDETSKEKLKQVLSLADYVKFAKVIPIEAENELTLANAIIFVNGTLRDEPQPGSKTDISL